MCSSKNMSQNVSKQNLGLMAPAVALTTQIWMKAYFRVCSRGRSGPKGPSIDSSCSESCALSPNLAGHFSLKQKKGLRQGTFPSALSGFQPAWVTSCCPQEILPHIEAGPGVSAKLEMSLGDT